MPDHSYFMGFARHAATQSKDRETKVGAALVTPSGRVCMTGYNGPPRGVEDRPERLCRPNKYPWMSHAEQNIAAFAASEGVTTKGCTLYVTHAPCSNCARSIIQAGIVCVAIGDGATTTVEDDRAIMQTMFDEAGIEIVVGFANARPKSQGQMLHDFSRAVSLV
jgi:dCMP deaminase